MKPPLFSCLTSRVAKNGSLYGRFLFGPLPIDTSLTVATVLRRSLLHSQATFTIVSTEIEGATHEYASLPGIQESVLEILLNLGEIVLTSTQRNFISPNFRTSLPPFEDPAHSFSFAFIRVSGPGVVTAKDIKWPKGVFCVKPNTYIATLSSNETLTMRLKIACSLNKNRHSLYDAETKVPKSRVKENNLPYSSSTKTSLLDRDSTLNIVKENKINKEVKPTNNKKLFESFKLQSLSNTTTPVNSSTIKTSLLHAQFQEIKKNLIPSKIKESRKFSNISNTLLAEQTKESRLTSLTNQTRSLDSYSSRKQNYTALPFSTRISKQAIFLENKSTSIRNLITYDNKKDEEQKNATFRVFPGLFNDFLDLSFIKKDVSGSSVQESPKSSDYEPVELEISSKSSKNSLFNTETNIKSFPLPTKKNKQKTTGKYELAVSSSSYPVEKVNFLIERDDELAGYRHRIILEVWTNGSISPRQAIFDSIGSIIKLIYNFREPLRNTFNNKFQEENSVI